MLFFFLKVSEHKIEILMPFFMLCLCLPSCIEVAFLRLNSENYQLTTLDSRRKLVQELTRVVTPDVRDRTVSSLIFIEEGGDDPLPDKEKYIIMLCEPLCSSTLRN